MKLTKSQRLCVAVGHSEYLAQRIAYRINSTRPSHWTPGKIGLLREETGELKRLRTLRKRLLREALEAWEAEEAASYNDGYMEGYRAGIYDD